MKFDPNSLSPQLPNFLSLFGGERHLTSVVPQERNDRGEEDDQDEIDRIRYRRLRTTPEDEDDFKNE